MKNYKTKKNYKNTGLLFLLIAFLGIPIIFFSYLHFRYLPIYLPVRSVAFSPDGKSLAAGSADKTTRIWDLSIGSQIAVLRGHSDWVECVVYSPDGKFLATGSGFTHDLTETTGRLLIWDAHNYSLLLSLEGHRANINSMMFSPDGKTLATGSIDGAVIWDISSGKIKKRFDIADSGKYVSFSPINNTLATAGGYGQHNNEIIIWDVDTEKELIKIKWLKNRSTVECLAFSPDGKTVASGGFQIITIWNISSGKELVTFEAHPLSVSALAFSPDGKTLATVGCKEPGQKPGEIKIWDLATGDQCAFFQDPSGGLLSLGFSPDGKSLAVGNCEGSVGLFEVPTLKPLLTLR